MGRFGMRFANAHFWTRNVRKEHASPPPRITHCVATEPQKWWYQQEEEDAKEECDNVLSLKGLSKHNYSTNGECSYSCADRQCGDNSPIQAAADNVSRVHIGIRFATDGALGAPALLKPPLEAGIMHVAVETQALALRGIAFKADKTHIIDTGYGVHSCFRKASEIATVAPSGATAVTA